MLPKSGTKIRELRRWYSVKGTWASRTVRMPTPNGRVMKYHSPKAVHRSYAIVTGTLIVVRSATDFTRNSTRIRVRASPRPASTTARHPRPISHPVLRCAETPEDDIAVVQGLVVGRDVTVDSVHPVLPVPASFPVHRPVNRRHEDALRDLKDRVREQKSKSGGGLGEDAERGVVCRHRGGVADGPAVPSHVECRRPDDLRLHGGGLKQLSRCVETRDCGQEDRREHDGLLALAEPKGHGGTSVESRAPGPRGSRRR